MPCEKASFISSQFSSTEVRTLAWALLSAPLVKTMDSQLPVSDEETIDFLTALDANPKPLQQHLAKCSSHRLGYYFEELWAFYLSHHPKLELLGHNLQVQNSDRRTLGAFDFIYRYIPTNSIHHLEVAVKFYLFIGEHSELSSNQMLWPGPNPKDNLGNKVNRLTTHQLKLPQTAEGRDALAGITEEHQITSSAALKGYLFYPWQQSTQKPEWAPDNHCNGQWLYRDKITELTTAFSESRWRALTKREWLGPVINLAEENTISGSELNECLINDMPDFPVMVTRICKTELGSWDEQERFFIAPERWPGTM
ncbi:DUF1853 family protein [Porticoccaceae bacterium LTM1]|nr:DUF1853 family protein [Porticoccaceae bacterium LTM1]